MFYYQKFIKNTALWQLLIIVLLTIGVGACKKDTATPAPKPSSDKGVFISNEGQFTYGNASLSYYNPKTKTVENNIFLQVNQVPVGDILQSLTLHNNKLYMVVNNSGKVYVIDPDSKQHLGTITGLTSPRYLHFATENKIYITDLYQRAISIADPVSLKVVDSINLDNTQTGHHTTEQMVAFGKYVFTNAWSYDNKILVIDTETDQCVDSITVPKQPNSMVLDKHNKLWVLTDGGLSEEEGALVRINPKTYEIEHSMRFPIENSPSELCINGTKDTLYFLNRHIYRLPIQSTTLPAQPFVTSTNTSPYGGFYGIAVSPNTSEVYASDAIDYVQEGIVNRYSAQGKLIDSFTVGVCPGAFCFKTE